AGRARDAGAVGERLDALGRVESRYVLATLIRLLGDFHVAEEGLAAAFAAALEEWPQEGAPTTRRSWLISTGRHKALDALRRRARLDRSLERLVAQLEREREACEP